MMSEKRIEEIAAEVASPASRYLPYWRTAVDFARAIEAECRKVPAGYVPVPVEPTEEMRSAAWNCRYAEEAYAAMLAAAPVQQCHKCGHASHDDECVVISNVQQFIASQEPISDEFAAILNAHREELYEGESVQQEAIDYKHELINLLCRIHRDGGHYIAEHGERKAIDDADLVCAENNARLDSLRQEAKPVSTELPLELLGIAETVKNGGGFWRSCSGCHETVEGHPLRGTYSSVMQCHLGNGCDECGGIGAVWDTTDYEAMAQAFAPIAARVVPVAEWPFPTAGHTAKKSNVEKNEKTSGKVKA